MRRRSLFCQETYRLICGVIIFACLGLAGTVASVDARRTSSRIDNSDNDVERRVKLTFIIIGCNRIQEADWERTRATNPSSANVPQLQQTFADITNLNPIPRYVFFMGDLVVNLKQDQGETLRGQLDAWAQLYFGDPSGIAQRLTLIPFTGNHEVLQSLPSDASKGAKVEVLNPATVPVWLDWLTRNGFDRFAGNGPTNAAPNLDMLQGDESRLTYSLDIGDTHFVVLNTDTVTTNLNIGWIAYHWIEQDIQRAENNREIRSIFVLGHKPIVGPIESVEPGNAIINPLNFRLASLLNRSGKVRAYLCAHAHLWEARQLGDSHAVWQVIAGNGGSQLASGWNPAGGQFYGFSLVKVYKDGKVGVISYRRPVPPVYFEGPTQPAQPQPEVFLTR
jgi:hypothetical protein